MLETVFYGIATSTVLAAFNEGKKSVIVTTLVGFVIGGSIMRFILHY